MYKYFTKRFLLLKAILYATITVMLVIGSVWFLGRTGVYEDRIERANKLASNYDNNIVYVQAPGLRKDVALDLVGGFSNKLYFDENQISQLKKIADVSEIIPLVGSAGDSEKLKILPYYQDVDIKGETVMTYTIPVPSEINPSKYLPFQLKAGKFPEDNTKQVAVSNYYKQAAIGKVVEYNSEQYTIVGIIDDKKSPQIILPYTSDGYQQAYYQQTVGDIEDFGGTKININEVAYGDLLIKFDNKPTQEELEAIDNLLPNGKVYYKDYTTFNGYQWLYVKLSWRKNISLTIFVISTSALLLSILKYILSRENKKLRFFNIPSHLINKGNRIEFYIQTISILGMSLFIYILLYTDMLLWYYIICVFLMLLSASVISYLFISIIKLLWGRDEPTVGNKAWKKNK